MPGMGMEQKTEKLPVLKELIVQWKERSDLVTSGWDRGRTEVL